jgi:glycosyltransferase involved in cell wall biosynthesis
LRVLLVNKFWKPSGGVEEHCRNLIELLSREGHEVVLFGMADPENEHSLPEERSVSAVSFHGGGLRERSRAAARACLGLETRRKIADLLANEHFDVAHVVHAYHQLGMTFMPLLRKHGIPTILDLHDYKVGCPRYLLFNDRTDTPCTVCIDRKGAWAWAPTLRRCWNGSRVSGMLLSAEALSAKVTRAYTAADCVVVRNDLQRRAAVHVGVPADRVRVIPNWVSDGHDEKDHTAGDHILFVGRLVREKGVHTLIQASREASLPIHVLGDGPMRADLEAQAARVGADITFLGWRGHDEVLAELRAARALVVPSVWPEVFPLVICEAFSAGVPVIGSDIGGIADLLDQKRGFVFPAGDVDRLKALLQEVVEDPAAAGERAASAREYSRQYLSYDHWREQYRDVYTNLFTT